MPSLTILGKLIMATVVVVVVAVGALVIWVSSSRGPGQTACTAEAMQCPDGSYVGRTGPNCEFAACPGATSTVATSSPSTTSTTTSQGSGIKGTVMLGPTCPVEQNPPLPQCADKPYQTLVAIFKASDPVHAVVITQSDAAGNFSAVLPPGEYEVGAGTSNLPRCNHPSATITAGIYAEVEVSCDTGIR